MRNGLGKPVSCLDEETGEMMECVPTSVPYGWWMGVGGEGGRRLASASHAPLALS